MHWLRNLWIALVLAVTWSGPVSPETPQSRLATVIGKGAAAGFSGVILVSEGDRILINRAVGSFQGRTVKTDSRFWISSTGKQFVSASLLLLQECGKLSLQDPISRWLPEAPSDKSAITIAQLMSHTSGIQQGYEGEESASNAEAVRRILAVPLETPRVHRFLYSNENYQLAAAIVERVSGLTLQEFERRKLFQPLGLKNTGIADGTAGVLPTLEPTPERLLKPQWGMEGHYSSAPDLLRWYKELRGGRVLNQASLGQLWAPTVPISEGHAALGWFVTTTSRGTKRIWTRGNDDFGANSLIYGYPDRDIVIVILTHSGDKPDGSSWSRAVVGELEEALAL